MPKPATALTKTQMGDEVIFGAVAPQYAEQGIRVIPTGGPDGKRPKIKNWHRVGLRAVPELMQKFSTANVAVIDGHCGGITRIDIDDPSLIDACIERFGDTPIKVGTPSGGLHLWYRANGEYRKTHIDGQKVDVLGRGGYGVAPPSINPQKGRYEFIQGGLPDLERLPRIRARSLPANAYRRGKTNQPSLPRSNPGRIIDGHRNGFLFREARRIALLCDSFEELLQQLHELNMRVCIPPETDGVILAKAESVWRLKEEGRCFAPGTMYAAIPLDQGQRLYEYPPALALWHFLKCKHAPDHEFAISPAGLATLLPHSAHTIAKARNFLLELRYLIRTHRGGRGEGDADRFRFGQY